MGIYQYYGMVKGPLIMIHHDESTFYANADQSQFGLMVVPHYLSKNHLDSQSWCLTSLRKLEVIATQ